MTKRICAVNGCELPHSSKGYCAAHYARLRRTGKPGTPSIAPPTEAGPCSVVGCERRRKARGFCQQHYVRWQRTGNPGPAEIRVQTDTRSRDERGRKWCGGCRTWVSPAKFLKSAKYADGLHARCYPCHRSGVLRRTYGVTMDWYEATLAAQGRVCALCGETNKDERMLAVDHDHACCPGRTSCGRCARALLCTKCNTGLGAFGDSVALLGAAIDYLKRGARGVAAAAP